MPDEEKDEKEESDSSTDSDLDEEELNAEEESDKDESEDEDTEIEEDDKDEDTESSTESETEETPEQLKERAEKAETKAASLEKALQEKRKTERQTVTQPTQPQAQRIDYGEAIVKSEEASAFQELYKDNPEYATDDTLYNQLLQDMIAITKVRGVVPAKKEDFLEIGKAAIFFRHGPKETEKKAEAKGRADAHKEQLKADAANIGGTSTSGAAKKETTVTEADRRAAKRAGMKVEDFVKYKDYYEI